MVLRGGGLLVEIPDVVVHHLGGPSAHLRGAPPSLRGARWRAPAGHEPTGWGRSAPRRGRRFSLYPPTVEFAVHHGTEIKACQAGDAKRKGKIERPFRGLEDSFLEELAVLGPPSSIAELNQTGPGVAGQAGERPGALDHRGRSPPSAWPPSASSSRLSRPIGSTPPIGNPAGSTWPCRSSSGTRCATRSHPSASARWSAAGWRWTPEELQITWGAQDGRHPPPRRLPARRRVGSRPSPGRRSRCPRPHHGAAASGRRPSRPPSGQALRRVRRGHP